MNSLVQYYAKNYVAIGVAIVVGLSASNAVGQQTATTDHGLAAIPSNATAFVHVDVAKMSSFDGLELPMKIAAEVQDEADRLFEKHFGVRLSELQSISYVVPDVESLMALQGSPKEQPGFGLFAFKNPISQDLDSVLPRNWKRQKIGSRMIFIDRNLQLVAFQPSPETIAIGSESSIRWLVKYRANKSAGGIRPVVAKAGKGQITIGFNGEGIPAIVKSAAPDEFKHLANLKTASITIDLNGGTFVVANLNYQNESDAAAATSFANEFVEKAVAMMKIEEMNSAGKFRSSFDNFDAAMPQLLQLAITRYGQKLTRETNITQQGKDVVVDVGVKGFNGHMMALTCLTAVQAVGAAAEDNFQNLANDLGSGNHRHELGEPSEVDSD